MRVRLAKQEDVKTIIRFDYIARSRKNRREFIKRSVLNKRCARDPSDRYLS